MSTPDDAVAVIGAGTSALVAELLRAGYHHLHAVDISERALDRLRNELGESDGADTVTYHAIDVRSVTFAEPIQVWHDRATFHFLTEASDRVAYIERAADAVPTGGHLVMATFALSGPEQCSGLSVRRYDAARLAVELHPWFDVVEAFEQAHHTPWGAGQSFLHVVARRTEPSARA